LLQRSIMHIRHSSFLNIIAMIIIISKTNIMLDIIWMY
jgi:hypothetical protein